MVVRFLFSSILQIWYIEVLKYSRESFRLQDNENRLYLSNIWALQSQNQAKSDIVRKPHAGVGLLFSCMIFRQGLCAPVLYINSRYSWIVYQIREQRQKTDLHTMYKCAQRRFWSAWSSLSAFWVVKDAKYLRADKKKLCITKTYLYNFKPHFYIVKQGFIGVYIFSYFCSKT